MTSSNDFSELDDLLTEALEVVAKEKAAKDAANRLKKGGQSAREREEDAARIAAWELENSWRPAANVALFERVDCTHCCRSHTTFTRLMTRYTSTLRGSTSERWLATDQQPDPKLPYETQVRKMTAPMCVVCLPEHGFSWNKVKEWTA